MRQKLPNIRSNDGRFHNGNPATGSLGTIVDDVWLNNVQDTLQDFFDEQKNVLAIAGMQPDPARNTQIADAIKVYFQSRLTMDTGVGSPNLAFSAQGAKTLAQQIARNQQDIAGLKSGKLDKSAISDAVNSTSQTQVASSRAVKTAYDKGVEAKTTADNARAFAAEKATDLDNRKLDKLVQQTVNLTGLNQNKWYPVIFKMPNMRRLYRFAIRRTLGDDNNPQWGTHADGFTAYLEWETQAARWGVYPYIDKMRLVSQFMFAYCQQSPVLKVGQIYQASWEYVYLRGGASYTLSCESDVAVEIGSNGYTWQFSSHREHLPVIDSYDESLVPKTNRQALQDAINTKADIAATLAGYGINDAMRVDAGNKNINLTTLLGQNVVWGTAGKERTITKLLDHMYRYGVGLSISASGGQAQIYIPHSSVNDDHGVWVMSAFAGNPAEPVWRRIDGADWDGIRNKPIVSRRDYSRTVRGTNANWDRGTSQNISVTGYVEIRPDGKIEQHFYFRNFRVWWFGVEPTSGEHAGPKIPVQLWTAMPNKVTFVSGHFSRNVASGIPAGSEATEWNHPIWAFEEQGNIKDRFSLYARRVAGGADERIDMYVKVEGY